MGEKEIKPSRFFLNRLVKRGDSQGKGTSLGFTPVRSSSARLIPFPDTSQNENCRELIISYILRENGIFNRECS